MFQSREGHQSATSGESMRERRLHEEEDANREGHTYEQSLRQAKMESIVEMLFDINKDPTLLEDFRGKLKAPKEEPPRKPRKTTPISPSVFTHHTNPFLHASLNPSFPGYMGGASAFQNMTGFMSRMTVAGPYPTYVSYGSSGLGSSGANLGHMGVGGFMDGAGSTFGSMGNAFLRPHPYDNLMPMGPLKDYKEGGSLVKFESFNGELDKKRALSFVQ